ncbi:hypothetical protein FPL14_05930 [Cohnella cholangitidis]|uniref:Glycosyl transferase family 2 n=2 Tax=Cohnella cholangitidis TaxID=2598458 RepID=A0A7G5BV11_9BACL|nr:hypothetical protein FPL14_05930 [Cohnella cholangitidis]
MAYRMSIFMKYTLQSLLKQTNQSFTALIRYAEATEDAIVPLLNSFDPLPGNIRFIPRRSKVKEQIIRTAGVEDLYLVHLDCDDMYQRSFIQQLHDFKPRKKTRALINQHGYVYDSVNHRMAAVTMPSPPFYTYIYKAEEYLQGTRYKAQGHRNVIRSFEHEILTDKKNRNFMAVVHERNKLNQKLLTRYKFERDRSIVDTILRKFK